MKLSPIQLQDYLYALPEDRIPLFPLPQRTQAKMLHYQHGEISHHAFLQLPELLPHNSILFLNDTKVIPARFIFKKDTGAAIEVFLLHPILPSHLLSTTLPANHQVTWICTIGNIKRWPKGLALKQGTNGIVLEVRLADRLKSLVEFSWTPGHLPFADIIQLMGEVPLPPYLKRKAVDSDKERYQTVYSSVEGAVAAPTAGLHFTGELLKKIHARGIVIDSLTLHVSAGTFLPIKHENAVDHPMHEEQVIIRRSNLENLMLPDKLVIAVGTTAMRTLESLYWYGVRLLADGDAPFIIEKLLPYQSERDLPSQRQAFQAIMEYMEQRNLEELTGRTSIFIFPGYPFKVCHGLITNFHQPGSSLLLLIAAFIGPAWKKVYNAALNHQYRFLSFGDSSFLMP